MLSIPLILAAGSLFTLISGAPVPSFPLGSQSDKTSTPLAERGAFVYVTYGGNGETSEGWPSQSQWISSFDTMFDNNKDIIKNSCTQFNVANPSDSEISDLHDAIESVASSTNIDARYILAIILQESNGCLRVPTTNGGVVNPGIMQDHDGSGTCNSGGVVQNPCPSSEILQMIKDGTEGTSEGDGLQQCLTKAGTTDDSKWYKAARIYNSGSIDSSGNLGLGVATHCYASDVANRLTGWDAGTSSCVPSEVGLLTATVGSTASSSTSDESAASSSAASSPAAVAASSPAASSVAAVAASTPAASTPEVALALPSTTPAAAAASPSTVTDSNPAPVVVTVTNTAIPVAAATSTPEAGTFLETGSSTSGTTDSSSGTGTSSSSASASSASSSPAAGVPVYPYAVSNCEEYYTVVAGDYCILVEQKFGITPQQLESWNSGLDDACTNLWLGYQYCVKAS